MATRTSKGGRTTPRRSGPLTPLPQARTGVEPTARKHPTDSSFEPSAPNRRYTPPRRDIRLRPRWHRAFGRLGVGIGLLIIVLNDFMLLDPRVTLLPFGHAEFYLALGVSIAGASTWFLGLFDRGTTVFE